MFLKRVATMNVGQVDALKLYQSMGGQLSGATFNAMQNAERGVSSPGPATRLEPAGKVELSGIYSDPRAKDAHARYDGSVSNAVDALRSIKNNELQAIKSSIRFDIEANLGRSLADDETFTTLTSEERMQLSADLRRDAMQAVVLELQILQGIGEADLRGGGFFGDDVPDKILDFFSASSTEEAIFDLIEKRVNQQYEVLTSVNELILNNPLMERAAGKVFSDQLVQALNISDADQSGDVRLQLFSKQWDQFSSGKTSLHWGSQKLAYSEAMSNAFVSSRVNEFR